MRFRAACNRCIFSLVVNATVLLFSANAPVRADDAGSHDPVFESVPFDKWMGAGPHADLRWSTRILGPLLAPDLRLRVRIEIELDGDEIAKRRGRGALGLLVQFEDSSGNRYQTHHGIDLGEVEQDTHKLNFIYSQDAFVLPGDYQVSFAAVDSRTGEYSAARRALHVNPVKNDPLPEAWKNLPPVELINDPPDELLLPSIRGKLNLPVRAPRPVHVELLVNATPSMAMPEQRARPIPPSMQLARIIPAMHVLSQIDAGPGGLNLAVLDLARKKVIFEQPSTSGLDLDKLRQALASADPKVIDAHSLQTRGKSAQFFGEQVRKRLRASDSGKGAGQTLRVLIVLSGPMEFESGENLHPLDGEFRDGARVFYVRYQPLRPVVNSEPDEFRPGRRILPPLVRGPRYAQPIDQLAPTLKALRPKVFEVYTPEDFKKAVATILDEISKS